MFFSTFAWSFVYVSLPFYIHRVSPYDESATLRWTGWILGVSSIITVLTAPAWGKLATMWSPKSLYIAVELLQGGGFFVMAMARTLPELFLARALLGVMGAASTFAYIIAGRAGGDVRREISGIQSASTVGQVMGPLAGAITANRLGFSESFVIGGLILLACAGLVWRRVVEGPEPPPAAVTGARADALREVGPVCLLVLAGSCQIFFLPAILPQMLPSLGVAPERTLEAGGLIIFATGVAAALGSMAAPWLAEHAGDRRTVAWFLGASSVVLAAFALAPEVWSFGGLRFIQVLCIAPVFPISVAAIAQRASGATIGLVNSARIAASFLGPVIATTLLAAGPAGIVYVVLAAIGFAVLPVVLRGLARPEASGRA